MLKSLKWEDWLGVALGVWLLASPWIFGYGGHFAAGMNALVLGTMLIMLEFLNLDMHDDVEEWLDIAAGVWLVASPFVLGYAQLGAAAINAVGVGVLAIVFAAWALSPMDGKLAPWWRAHFGRR